MTPRAPGLRSTAAAALALLALAACATPEAPPAPGPVGPAPSLPANPAFDILPGWSEEDHLAALSAWREACPVARRLAPRACEAALSVPGGSAAEARAYFEAWFTPQPVEGEGLMTAYFAPEYEARSAPDAEFSAALHALPADLVVAGDQVLQRREDGTTVPYPDRAEIEARGGPALAWLRPEDKLFLQIQGSGYLTFPDGRSVRAAYAGTNGRPYVAVAGEMIRRGLIERDRASAQAISAWLAAHAGPEAQAIINTNPRYVFFRLDDRLAGHPSGAAGIPLTPGRSIAVDPAHWPYGELLYLDASGEGLAGATASYRGLVVALDTGSAIRGQVRADYYMGRGEAAGRAAGTVRHPLRFWRLVPRETLD